MIVPITMGIPSNNLEWPSGWNPKNCILSSNRVDTERGYQEEELSLRQPTLWKNLTHRKGKYV
jgi:hypothetical protein